MYHEACALMSFPGRTFRPEPGIQDEYMYRNIKVALESRFPERLGTQSGIWIPACGGFLKKIDNLPGFVY